MSDRTFLVDGVVTCTAQELLKENSAFESGKVNPAAILITKAECETASFRAIPAKLVSARRIHAHHGSQNP